MCGIFASFDNPPQHLEALRRRGPDYFQIHEENGVWFAASVLHLRGQALSRQPVVAEQFVLLFNGEIYDVSGSDTEYVSASVERLLEDSDAFEARLVDFTASLNGEFAFLLYVKATDTLYATRGVLGMRSLLTSGRSFVSAIDIPGDYSEVPAGTIVKLCKGETTQLSLPRLPIASSPGSVEEVFLDLLEQSVKRRVLAVDTDPHIAVLFSGGLDCAVLTLLADKYLDPSLPIDLYNIAFENVHVPFEKVPDRLTGLSSLEELRHLCPNRKFNFVEMNISREEFERYEGRVRCLMAPSDTVMDLSIASPFWFLGRGAGVVDGQPYSSPSKILLSGFGADELLGGYTRYRAIYQQSGLDGLQKELDFDFDRIPRRNLGRDDRVLSDHGKEVRFPYLDRDFLVYVRSVPVEERMDLSSPDGTKLLLRKVARTLGFHKAAGLEKRAIQFGAKSAKITGIKQRGEDKLL